MNLVYNFFVHSILGFTEVVALSLQMNLLHLSLRLCTDGGWLISATTAV